jgi:hypothetical protein
METVILREAKDLALTIAKPMRRSFAEYTLSKARRSMNRMGRLAVNDVRICLKGLRARSFALLRMTIAEGFSATSLGEQVFEFMMPP